jgi:hypothetical protein
MFLRPWGSFAYRVRLLHGSLSEFLSAREIACQTDNLLTRFLVWRILTSWMTISSLQSATKNSTGYTKSGAYMCEADAQASGNRTAKNERHP